MYQAPLSHNRVRASADMPLLPSPRISQIVRVILRDLQEILHAHVRHEVEELLGLAPANLDGAIPRICVMLTSSNRFPSAAMRCETMRARGTWYLASLRKRCLRAREWDRSR